MQVYLMFLSLLNFTFVTRIKAKYGCKEFDYLPCIKNETLTGHVIKSSTIMAPGLKTCQRECFNEGQCVSYNLGPVEGQTRTCELSAADHWMRPKFLVSKEGFEYCPIKNPCSSNPCPANRLCTPDLSWDTFSCNDGGWSQWSSWDVCCNKQTKRSRSCSNPAPLKDGSQCVGQAQETKECLSTNGLFPKNIGCFKDVSNNRTFPIYVKMSTPVISGMPGNVCSCAVEVQSRGYKIFGVQYGGECWSGQSDLQKATMHGPSNACKNSLGGPFANDVYVI